ncbi:HAMP domain-containing protein [bacterium]|nr:HAMP domain-containing protein [bacterium]
MKKALLLTGLIFVFLLFPIFLLYRDQRFAQELRRENEIEEIKRFSKRQLDYINRGSESETQLLNLLCGFQIKLVQILKQPGRKEISVSFRELYKNELEKNIPKHHLVISMPYHGSQKIVFENSTGGEKFPRIPKEMILFAQNLPDEYSSAPAILPQITEVFHFPFPLNTQCQNLTVFHSSHGTFGLLLNFLNYGSSKHRGQIFAILDLSEFGSDFGPKSLISTWKDPKGGIAFLPKQHGDPIFSEFVLERPKLRKYLTEAAFGRVILKELSFFESLLIRSTPPSQGMPFRSVVAYELPKREPSENLSEAKFFAISFLFFLSGVFLTVEKGVYGRGFKLTVRIALLGTFLVLSLLPITGSSMILRRVMAMELLKARHDIANSLHRLLQSIDEGAQFKFAALMNKINLLSNDSEFLKLLSESEKLESMGKTSANPMEYLARKTNPREFKSKSSSQFNLIAAAGKGNFVKNWLKYKSRNSSDPNQSEMSDLIRVLGPVSRYHLRKLNPNQVELTNKLSVSADGPKNIQEEYMVEMIAELLLAMTGPETYVNLFQHPGKLSEIKTTFGRVYITQIPVHFQREVKYIITWMWDTVIMDTSYLREIFNPIPKNLEGVFGYSVSHEWGRGDTIPSGIASFPLLSEMAEMTKSSATTIQIASGDDMLFETMPCHYMDQYVLAGATSTRHLGEEVRRKEIEFKMGVSLLVLFSLILGFSGVSYVLIPLRRVQEAVGKIKNGQFTTRLDSSRADEFGSLGKAFNLMATKLQEGKILGQYVSSGVKRAVQDSKFQETATIGETRDVIVLFSLLDDFEEFQETHDPKQVFQLLESHLMAVNEAIEKVAPGEVDIDKVIGEKIMVVFDYERCGGSRKAGEKTLGIIKGIKDFLLSHGSPLSPVMGVNSGPVIAGILGAQAARKDYTVIGDTVNLAARLAVLAHTTEGTKVVVSGNTLEFFPASLQFKKLPFKRVKGKTQEVEAYLLGEAK